MEKTTTTILVPGAPFRWLRRLPIARTAWSMPSDSWYTTFTRPPLPAPAGAGWPDCAEAFAARPMAARAADARMNARRILLLPAGSVPAFRPEP